MALTRTTEALRRGSGGTDFLTPDTANSISLPDLAEVVLSASSAFTGSFTHTLTGVPRVDQMLIFENNSGFNQTITGTPLEGAPFVVPDQTVLIFHYNAATQKMRRISAVHRTTASGGGGGGGDMLASTYDPNAVTSDAFDMANMVEAADAKVMTAAERTKLTGVETNAAADQSASEVPNDSSVTGADVAAVLDTLDSHDPPAGGNTDQVLTKLSNADYDFVWEDPSAGGGSGPPFNDDVSLLQDAVDPTKELRVEVGAITTGTQRVLTQPDQNIDLTPDTGSFAAATHAARHTDGSDDVQDATAGQKGLMTAAYATKLDGIESGATADQTGAEIKVAYEGEADTNAFTDAEQTKLAGIEASADVTDATNVNAAGAIMHSDISESDGYFLKTGAETYEAVKVNRSATAAPTQNDDSSAGYSIGSKWFDVTNDQVYDCVDASVGAAVWIETGGTAGGAPTGAQYLVLATNAALTGERRFVAGDGLVATDAGAGADYTLDVTAVTDTTAIVKGSADDTKLWRVEVDGFTTGTTRVLTPADRDWAPTVFGEELAEVANAAAARTKIDAAQASHTHTLTDVTDSGPLAPLTGTNELVHFDNAGAAAKVALGAAGRVPVSEGTAAAPVFAKPAGVTLADVLGLSNLAWSLGAPGLVTVEYADGSTAVVSGRARFDTTGARVRSITDRSGAVTFSNTTYSQQPDFKQDQLGGRPAMDFRAADNTRLTTTWNSGNELTIWAFGVRVDGLADDITVFSNAAPGSTTEGVQLRIDSVNGDVSLRLTDGTNQRTNSLALGAQVGDVVDIIATASLSGDDADMYARKNRGAWTTIDDHFGNVTGIAATTDGALGGRMVDGSYQSNDQFDGLIAETGAMDGIATADELGILKAWADAWGGVEHAGFDIASQAQAEAGTNNATGMTPLRTAQAISALGGSGDTAPSQVETTATPHALSNAQRAHLQVELYAHQASVNFEVPANTGQATWLINAFDKDDGTPYAGCTISVATDVGSVNGTSGGSREIVAGGAVLVKAINPAGNAPIVTVFGDIFNPPDSRAALNPVTKADNGKVIAVTGDQTFPAVASNFPTGFEAAYTAEGAGRNLVGLDATHAIAQDDMAVVRKTNAGKLVAYGTGGPTVLDAA